MSINVNDKNLGHATAYAYYKAGGGTMTEAEFTEFMADFGTASQTAVEAAQAALASETAARNASTTATNKATEATTAATTATTKAGEASTSASTATSAKDTAVSASQTATTKATEATTAAATATSAKTDAVAANTAAQSAKTAAQTAQSGAETAAASVSASAAQIATNTEDISQLKSEFTAEVAPRTYDGDFTDGKYLANNGNLYDDGRTKVTDYIAVLPNDTITMHLAYPNSAFSYATYDSGKNKVKVYPYDGSTHVVEFTIPDGVRYVRVTYTKPNASATFTDYVIITDSIGSLIDKGLSYIDNSLATHMLPTGGFLFEKICCIGDSLTAGVYSDTLSGKGYPYFLAKILNCDTENLGIGGTSTKTWYERKDTTFSTAQLDFSQYDCFILYFGTNGGLGGTPDPTEDTMLGWYAKIVELIRTSNANAPIFLVISGWTNNRDYYGLDHWITQIELLATAYSLPVIRLDKSTVLTYVNRDINQPYDHKLHYGMFGYLRMASEMVNYMNYAMNNNGAMFATLV